MTEFFRRNPSVRYSARELINDPTINIGEATVYRLLSRLTSDGLLIKELPEKDGGALYHYNETAVCKGHIHLKCLKCDNTICLDDPDSRSLEAVVCNGCSGFEVDDAKTTIYGVCRNCKNR